METLALSFVYMYIQKENKVMQEVFTVTRKQAAEFIKVLPRDHFHLT